MMACSWKLVTTYNKQFNWNEQTPTTLWLEQIFPVTLHNWYKIFWEKGLTAEATEHLCKQAIFTSPHTDLYGGIILSSQHYSSQDKDLLEIPVMLYKLYQLPFKH
jgi:hypothetical protein